MSPYILVVDDSADIRWLITETLRPFGYEVLESMNGQDALNLLGEVRQLPSAITVDLEMPEMSGQTFCSEIKKNVRYAEIPVVILSDALDVAEVAAHFGVGFLAKRDVKNLPTILTSLLPSGWQR